MKDKQVALRAGMVTQVVYSSRRNKEIPCLPYVMPNLQVYFQISLDACTNMIYALDSQETRISMRYVLGK